MIKRGVLILSKLSTFSNDFLLGSSTGSTPGFMTNNFFESIPFSIARFFVYSELAITFSTLFKTFLTLLLIKLPKG